MVLNAQKTVYTTTTTIFSNSNEVLRKELNIHAGAATLSRENAPRYLGVILDPRLNLARHVGNQAMKAIKQVSPKQTRRFDVWNFSLVPSYHVDHPSPPDHRVCQPGTQHGQPKYPNTFRSCTKRCSSSHYGKPQKHPGCGFANSHEYYQYRTAQHPEEDAYLGDERAL
ncbi:hypothetical protein ElyMa_004920700 [Elysia marginata]|uniref:Uncharacterized protein n=1 Tax=Elysia marginata TaxID=1093978 RepID=A0AAV4IZ35_9GAST|nr:hypothetical protein ElyMa_004920700 [Elysia marginata]